MGRDKSAGTGTLEQEELGAAQAFRLLSVLLASCGTARPTEPPGDDSATPRQGDAADAEPTQSNGDSQRQTPQGGARLKVDSQRCAQVFGQLFPQVGLLVASCCTFRERQHLKRLNNSVRGQSVGPSKLARAASQLPNHDELSEQARLPIVDLVEWIQAVGHPSGILRAAAFGLPAVCSADLFELLPPQTQSQVLAALLTHAESDTVTAVRSAAVKAVASFVTFQQLTRPPGDSCRLSTGFVSNVENGGPAAEDSVSE